MKIMFMCLGTFDNLAESSVHIDLVKRLAEDHEVWLICKHEGKPTEQKDEYGIHVLRVHTGELKKIGLIKKGINTVFVEPQFTYAIKKHLKTIRFDLILYTTPPITFANAVKYIKNRDHAMTYLMLKDIFPQNAVDIGLMHTMGLGGMIYRYFRKKEKQLYNLSDYIGCMSPANVEYIIQHNPEIDRDRVEVCPNITNIRDASVSDETRLSIREEYRIPTDKKVFIYGGNLGKPQGIPFLLECLRSCKKNSSVFFLIIGQGTEYGTIEKYINEEHPTNCTLMRSIPNDDYETLVAACDIGMIFLDHRFTIPNFPSRLLSYMKAKIPVFAVTDIYTDVGETITNGGFGWWCESNDIKSFCSIVKTIIQTDDETVAEMKRREFDYLCKNYNPDIAYDTICSKAK